MKTPAIRIHDLAVDFGDTPGLRGLSFSLAPGERLAVVGPSGAGKTSLLRAIAGLAPLRAGTLEIDGRDVGALPPERRGAVYLHQAPVLFPHLSVGENVAFPLRVRRVPRLEVDHRVTALLEAVGLRGFEDRPPRTLSGGQRHRVALARAVAARPALLLLDEPLTALDPGLREDVGQAILDVQSRQAIALVIVTHDLDEAAWLGDRIGVLLAGHLAQVATPEHLFAKPASLEVARFLGFRNEVAGVSRDGVFESVLGRIPVGGPVRSDGEDHGTGAGVPGPAVAVFRPDAIRMTPGGGVRARVIEVRYRGDGARVILDLGGSRLEAAAPMIDLPDPGTETGLEIDPDRVRVFPR